MAAEHEPLRADRPHEVIREEVLAVLEAEDVLPIKQFGVGGARYVYEKMSENDIDLGGERSNYLFDPDAGTATAVDGNATFPAVGRLGALYALWPPSWRLKRALFDGRRDAIPVRVYRTDADPTILFFHGGGYTIGSLESHDGLCRAIADASEATVVSVGYRLAPEHPHPTQELDCFAVLAWAADRFGSETLVVAGDSAGAGIASVVPVLARDRGGPDIDQQWLVYPPSQRETNLESHSENAEGYVLGTADVEWFREQRFSGEGQSEVPTYVTDVEDRTGLPPATVVTAGFDPIRDEGFAVVEALDSAGVAVDHQHYPDMVHGFLNVLDDPSVPAAWETIAYLGDKI